MKTTVEFGRELENLVVGYLKKLTSLARRSKASGASTELYDITTDIPLAIECKNTNKNNLTINKKVWEKLLSEIPCGTLRIPVLIQQNKHKDVFVSLSIEDFFRIYTGYYEKEKNRD